MDRYPQEIIEFLKTLKTFKLISRNGKPNIFGVKFLKLLEKYSLEIPKQLSVHQFCSWIVNDVYEHKKCRNESCNNLTRLSTSKHNVFFLPYCCMKCYKSDPKAGVKISKIKTALYSNPEWKKKTENKKINTCIKKFKCSNPMQNPDIFEKQQKSCFTNAIEIDGMRLIGREPFAYEWLSMFNYKIHSGSKYLKENKLKIVWIDDSNKEHLAFPDFFVEDENAFVEIKGTYTRQAHAYKISKIEQAVNKMGYNYFVMTIKNGRKGFISTEPFIID